MPRRRWRRTRGSAPLQATLLLGAGLAGVAGLREVYRGLAPTAAANGQRALTGTVGGSPNGSAESGPAALPPVTPTPAPAPAPPLGSLSAGYESGDNGPAAYNDGTNDSGGPSYGTYQMSTNSGMAQLFADTYYPAEFAGLKAGTDAFRDAWLKLAADPGTVAAFRANEHAHMKAENYDRLARRLDRLGLDLATRSAALRDVVWSTAVQHGPGNSKPFQGGQIVQAALAPLLAGGRRAADLSDREIVEAVYAERDRRKEDGTMAHFPTAGPTNGNWTRFPKERDQALGRLANE